MFTIRFFCFFILSFLIAGNTYAKNCKKGKPCGNSCIAKWKTCRSGTTSSNSSTTSKRFKKKKRTKSYTPASSYTYTSPKKKFTSDTSEPEEILYLPDGIKENTQYSINASDGNCFDLHFKHGGTDRVCEFTFEKDSHEKYLIIYKTKDGKESFSALEEIKNYSEFKKILVIK